MPTLKPRSRVRLARRGRVRVPAGRWVLLAASALLTVVAAPASIAHAEPTKQPVAVNVSSSQRWTKTGLTVKTGETITISASGTMSLGPAPIESLGPAGKPPVFCADLIKLEGKTRPFPAPGLDCWSLIGMIGSDQPFQVGSHTSFSATSDGELLLGLNDNRLEDNSGSWSATVSIASGSGTAPAGGSSSKSNTLLYVIAAVAILLVLAALLLLSRRSRDRRAAVAAAPAEALTPPAPPIMADISAEAFAIPAAVILDERIEQPAEESVGSFAKAPGPLGTSVAPVEGEVVDVNIFEVELANGTDLRVGYNYFPEETDLHWQVRQGSLFAHGQFPTNGGGNMYHFVTLPLGVHLEPAPAAVDVQFTWAIGGVPFRYSVRRDPGL